MNKIKSSFIKAVKRANKAEIENIAPIVKCDICGKETRYPMTNYGEGCYCTKCWKKKILNKH